MSFGWRWLGVLVLATMACGEPPPTNEFEPIIGVKIYQTDRELSGLFDQWRELGINTAFVSREIAAVDRFHELAAASGTDVFVIFPVFYAPEELAANPDWWAVTAEGKRAKEDWVEFACPSRPELRQRRIETAREIARMCQPAGLSVDFIRHFVFWEMVGPERDASTLPDTCYCPLCLDGFAEFSGIDRAMIPRSPMEASGWIGAQAAEAWIDFKTATITSMADEIATAVREVDPTIDINIHLVPWRAHDFDGAVTRIAAQDRAELGSLADFLSPMSYSFMLHREPEWIGSVVEDVASSTDCPVLPSIQVASAYREGESFTAGEFESALRAALAPPSAGIVFWSWDHIEADPEKADVIRRVVKGF